MFSVFMWFSFVLEVNVALPFVVRCFQCMSNCDANMKFSELVDTTAVARASPAVPGAGKTAAMPVVHRSQAIWPSAHRNRRQPAQRPTVG